MNQRIKKLAEQASTFASRETTDLDEWEFIFRKKFAQLIVAECAQVSEDDITDGNACCTNTADRIARQIKKHFGVAEC